MRYINTESPRMVGRFSTGATVTITITKLSDGSVEISSAACSEIGSSGYFQYDFDPPSGYDEYLWVMTDDIDEVAGSLVVDGVLANLDAKVSEVSAATPAQIRAEMDANSKLANLPADPADESSIEAAITAAHATTDALISAITGGGLTEKTYTLTDASTGLPLVGVQVWATTDEAGLNQVDITRATNDAGQVTFRFNLAAGTPIYIWNRYMAEGDAPDEEEV